jgi:hypothetical protein
MDTPEQKLFLTCGLCPRKFSMIGFGRIKSDTGQFSVRPSVFLCPISAIFTFWCVLVSFTVPPGNFCLLG